jgi:hypothetical protein
MHDSVCQIRGHECEEVDALRAELGRKDIILALTRNRIMELEEGIRLLLEHSNDEYWGQARINASCLIPARGHSWSEPRNK